MMKSKKELPPLVKELFILIISALVLTLAINYNRPESSFYEGLITFLVILLINYGIKKLVAHFFEISITIKPWEIRHFGFKEKNQFKKPINMIWWPLFVSLLTLGKIWWLPILEFDARAKPERAVRRHQQNKFSEVTENHVAYIVFWSIMATLLTGLVGYFIGFIDFFKISVFYAFWSLVPISRLDGSKLFFGEKWLWGLSIIIILIFSVGVLTI